MNTKTLFLSLQSMYDSSRKNSDASYKQINQPKLTPENLKLRGNRQIDR